MTFANLRVALFSGNYNYVRDGANQALNRLVDFLLRQGAQVRVYSPTTDTPAFPPAGDLVSLPSLPIPGRGEYRFPMGLPKHIRDDLESFAPNILHLSSPDLSARAALRWAKRRNLPVLASVHTRFETYPRYYGLGFAEPWLVAYIRRFYTRCDALVAPSESLVEVLHQQQMNGDISIWSRGVDRTIFDPAKRDEAWRQSIGIEPGDVAIAFLGRLVLEKGLKVFSDTTSELTKRGIKHKVLVIGDGPARSAFESALPQSIFAGFLTGAALGRALACGDVFFNPSTTEAFGNVTLEAMACGLPVVAARATGSTSIVLDGISGQLVEPDNVTAYADALSAYVTDPALRSAHGAAGELRSRDFSWDAINSTVAETYVRLVGQRARTAA